MPLFKEKPPVFEAREFTGGEANALDLRGWALSSGVQATHTPGLEEAPEVLVIHNADEDETVQIGQWVIRHPGPRFEALDSHQLFDQYERVLG